MKTRLLLLIPLLLFAGCSTTKTGTALVYSLDSNGDLQANNVTTTVPDEEGIFWNKVMLIGGGAVLTYAIGYNAGWWGNGSASKDSTTTSEPATPSNPLIQTGGSQSSEWTGEFIQPIYQPL